MEIRNLIYLFGMVKVNNMKNKQSWLPELITFNPSKNNIDEYIEGIYQIFVEEFINKGIYFKGERLKLKKIPMKNNKEATFYHMISEGEDENNRTIDLERCARIKWPRAILASDHKDLKIWTNKRKNKNNILVWYEEQKYLIVIRVNLNKKLFWTAYPVNRKHTEKKLKKEFEDYQKSIQKSPQ